MANSEELRTTRWASGAGGAFPGPDDRDLEVPVTPADSLILARMVAIVVVSALAYSFTDGPVSEHLVIVGLLLAVLQPAIPVFWRFQRTYRQAQMYTDLAAFAMFVVLAPEFYWLGAIAVAAIVGNHAVLASVREYVVTAALAVAVLIVVGQVAGVEHYWRGVGLLIVLAAGLGYLGYRTRSAMRATQGDLLHALGAAGGLAHLTDLTGGVVDVVGDTESVVGWTRQEWLEMDHREIIHPDDFLAFWKPPEAVMPGELVDRLGRIRTGDGRWIWLRDVSRVVMHENRPHLRGFTIDVSAQQDGLKQVTNEAATDVLTGLKNRRALLVGLEMRRDQPNHHLILIDLNRFKDINDTLGHEAGDVLLQVVADRLTRSLRPEDVIARLGGDEFAIVMDAMPDTASVAAVIDRVAFEIASPVEIGGVHITTSISAGIVDARHGGADDSTMLRHADIAMYSAKRANTPWAIFDDALERTSRRRAVLSQDLQRALHTGELSLHYQPIVDVATRKIVSAEGLARWDHPEFGLLAPDSFLDVVLMSDRSGDFTRSMVLDGIGTAAALLERGADVTVAVNLPIKTFEDPEFSRWFVTSCEQANVPPSQIVLEITERDIHDTASITQAIDRLAESGATISVDDFGSGHATFERLRWGNVAQLKLDRDVVRYADRNRRDRAVLRSILGLAAELGYDVVAEGVETEEQLELLAELDCPHAQGYLFARPAHGVELLANVTAALAKEKQGAHLDHVGFESWHLTDLKKH